MAIFDLVPRSWIRKNKKNQDQWQFFSRQALELLIFQEPLHLWILQNRMIKSAFEEFFTYLPKSLLEKIVTEQIRFVSLDGMYSCAVSEKNIIIIFPELLDMLKGVVESPFKAILAHELGHLILCHGQRDLSILEAQVEADRFAIELGFAQELEQFLLSQEESLEVRVRLSYLTSQVLTG